MFADDASKPHHGLRPVLSVDDVGNARVLTQEEVDFAVEFGHRQEPASWPVHFIEGLHFLDRGDGKG